MKTLPFTSHMFYVVLVTYLTLLILTGGFAFFLAFGFVAIPPADLNELVPDAELRTYFLKGLETANQKAIRLWEVATSGFQVVLGAVIGFLSAIATTFIRAQNQEGEKAAQADTPATNPARDAPVVAPEANRPPPVPASP